MATKQQLLQQLQAAYPDYWTWLQAKPNALKKVQALAGSVDKWGKLEQTVLGLKSYNTFLAGGTGDEPPPTDEVPPPEDVLPTTELQTPQPQGDDIRNTLMQFLRDNDLPDSLMGFITDALKTGMSSVELLARLRETPEYLAAYPENALRKDAGFSWLPEAQIRAMRDEINRLTESYFNIRLTPGETATIISKDKSLSEWEGQLRDYATFQRWGPTVQAILQQELGYAIPDERAFALISADMSTPELDRAYEMALRRGQPAVLGLGIRPEDEAALLQRYGISVQQAFQGYQGIVSEMPRAERLGAIEAEINRNVENFPTGTELFAGTPFATLFRAIQLGDPEAIANLQGQLSREVARFQAGGAPAGGGAGLLSPEELARR
jgi:hypothetical protein